MFDRLSGRSGKPNGHGFGENRMVFDPFPPTGMPLANAVTDIGATNGTGFADTGVLVEGSLYFYLGVVVVVQLVQDSNRCWCYRTYSPPVIGSV
jgi:hypothetical protein